MSFSARTSTVFFFYNGPLISHFGRILKYPDPKNFASNDSATGFERRVAEKLSVDIWAYWGQSENPKWLYIDTGSLQVVIVLEELA